MYDVCCGVVWCCCFVVAGASSCSTLRAGAAAAACDDDDWTHDWGDASERAARLVPGIAEIKLEKKGVSQRT